MITRTFQNPFYSPVLNYEETKTESNYEKELLSRYIGFLNSMNEKRLMIKELRNQYYYEQMLTEECDAEIERILTRYKGVEKVVKEIKRTMTIDPVDFPLMHKYNIETNKMYTEFHEQMVDKLRDCINTNDAVFDKLYDWFEGKDDNQSGEEKAFTYFEDYAQELYTNYDNYALDLCRFDKDVDDMKGEWQKADDEYEKLFDLREATVKTTTAFCNKISEVNELCKLLDTDLVEMEDQRKGFHN